MLTLKNRYLEARFDPTTGALIHLSAANDATSLIKVAGSRYEGPQGTVGEGFWPEDRHRFEFAQVTPRLDQGMVESQLRCRILLIRRTFTLSPQSPLLKVTCTAEALADPQQTKAISILPALPQFDFTDDFVDAFEDEKDLFFPGLEIGPGIESAPWHVFFRNGHRDGLILAARSKRRMAQIAFHSRGFRGTPHSCNNYTTNPVPAMPLDAKARYSTEFEIGPWSQSRHASILKLAQLNVPVRTSPARKPTGKRPARKRGIIIPAVKIAPPSAITKTFHTRKWLQVALPWTLEPKTLFAGTGVTPPTLKFTPSQRGLYRIHIGIGSGMGITCAAPGQPYPTLRWRWDAAGVGAAPVWPFDLFLSGRQTAREMDMGVYRLTGKPLHLKPLGNRLLPCMLDYIRLEKLSPAAAARWERQSLAQPSIPLSGFVDTPDIAFADSVTNPDPDLYRANIWEHARCKIKRIYWRIDGQCSDFPSPSNTMRYISAKVHGVFYPGSKAYGKVLRKTDMLRLAVDEAHKHGLELYGWMRFNSYSGNVQSDFFRQNPQFHEVRENGGSIAKLCIAIPQVRKHKIDILCEAAQYGIDGLNLGFLRMAPVLMNHPVLVDSYKARYGILPPTVPSRPDKFFYNSLPPDDEESTRWHQHRADFLTLFGRELKERLHAIGRGNIKISLWLRPNHCLYDGIDLPAWLNHGLCDEVVVNGVIGPERVWGDVHGGGYDPAVNGVHPRWKAMVQAKVPLIRTLAYASIKTWRPRHLPEVLAENYDGLCTYESDWSVLNSQFVDLYRGL
jgi:hypothetical protein